MHRHRCATDGRLSTVTAANQQAAFRTEEPSRTSYKQVLEGRKGKTACFRNHDRLARCARRSKKVNVHYSDIPGRVVAMR